MGDINGSPLFFPSVGYTAPPVTATYFFTPRDEFHTAAMYRTDLSVNYAFNFGSQTRSAELFFQAQIRNLFNQFQLFNMSADEINTTVLTANDDPDRFETFNPFAQTPVEGVHWAKGTNFGKARSKDAYTLPRTFLFSLGARF
jgi:hypothetical protein